jgi:PhzF family phenazine biosynthesis protein
MSDPQLWLVDAFTEAPFRGNPAGVVAVDEDVSTEWMAAVARELGVSDTAFVLTSGPSRTDFELRWFTPVAEVDLCGHATLAAAHCLFDAGATDPIRFRTRSDVLVVRRRRDGSLVMDLPASAPTPAGTATRNAVADAVGAELEWAGRTSDGVFLLAELADEGAVREIVPDLGAIGSLDASALVVTAPADEGRDYDFVSRVFAPKIGIPEDPVTGSAHTVLACFWADRLSRTALVGWQASHRPGRLEVQLHGDRVSIAGRAVTVARGKITAAA